MSVKTEKSVRLTESAVMIALGTVLSVFKLIDLPYGGSVTFAHMLPVILIAYRYGTGYGLFVGAVYGLLQMLLGIKNLFALNVVGVIAVLLLDYVLAYTASGLGGLFRRRIRNQSAALAAGAFVACFVRYIFHVISGVTVWNEWAFSMPVLSYSLVYNATYMIPETIVTVTAAAYIGSVLDFRSGPLHRLQREQQTDVQVLLNGMARLALAAAAIYDVQAIFSRLQDAETGTFSAALMATAPFGTMALVTLLGLAVAFVCGLASRKQDLSVLSRGLWAGAAVGGIYIYCDYAAATLSKAASKADLADPFSSASAFFAAFPALGVKYGVPLIVALVSLVVLVVLAVQRVRKHS